VRYAQCFQGAECCQTANLDANDIQKPVDFDQFRTTVKTLGLYWLAVNQSPMTNHAPQPPELAD